MMEAIPGSTSGAPPAAAPRPGEVPSALTAVATMASVTLKRLRRGLALWIGAGFAALPIVFAAVMTQRWSGRAGSSSVSPSKLFDAALLLLAVLPAMFVASSIGEEIEHRTSTYLWSRPIPRWGVLAGKLVALVPAVLVLTLVSWAAAAAVATSAAPPVMSCIALAAGCIAVSLVATGVATLVPGYGLVLTIGYVLADLFIGAMPFSLAELSITHQASVLADLADGAHDVATPLIWLAIVSATWLTIALLRIRRLEV